MRNVLAKLTVAFVLLSTGSATAMGAGGLSIKGTYQLEKRVLPDGTVQVPPTVVGLLTFTDGLRNFNVAWQKEDGTRESLAIISEYQLTATEYREKNLYFLHANEAGSTPVVYDLSPVSGTAALDVAGGVIRFKLPNFDEPSVIFAGDSLKAFNDSFTDHWKKVD